MKQHRIFISQDGRVYHAATLKALRQQVSGRVSIMYTDGKDGRTYRVGYVIGNEWLTEFKSVVKPVT